MWLTLALVLIVLWLLGWLVELGGPWLHLLLPLAVALLALHWRRPVG